MSPIINNIDNAAQQMRKGVLEFCILLVISRGEVYASDIIDALKKADLLVVEGTLYPILSRLRAASLVAYVWVESESGPPRKYYSLTAAGRTTLAGLTDSWTKLSKTTHSLIKQYEKDN